MRRDDVRPLLLDSVDSLPEPDLADEAWSAGLTDWKRRRRVRVVVALVVIVAAVVAAVLTSGGRSRTGPVPPTTPPSNVPGYIQPAGQIAGIDFWLAPPAGSEAYLDRIHTPLGDVLRYPDRARPLADGPLERLAAVVLAERDGWYEPLLMDADSTWARPELMLRPIRTGSPLSAGAISPDGRFVAFPQPGGMVAIDVTNAQEVRYPVPTEDIREVAWFPDGNRVLASGPNAAYRILVGQGFSGEKPLVTVAPHPDPAAVTAPFRLADGAVYRYLPTGRWGVDSALQLPVQSWNGHTFTAPGGGVAARLFVADGLAQVPTVASQPQVVAAIATLRAEPSRLLVLGETPPNTRGTPSPATPGPAAVREPGCCAIIGWYNERVPVVQVKGWLLGWDLRTGQVHRITELEVPAVAVGPGLRS